MSSILLGGVKLAESAVDNLRRHTENLRTGKNPYLDSNYAPVADELTNEPCRVVSGALPGDLRGAFLRNGPNPKYAPRGLYHWFDGDGMVHGVRLSGGSSSGGGGGGDGGGGGETVAHYGNHQVRTEKLAYEDARGGSDMLRVGDMKGPLGVLKIMLFYARPALGDAPLKRILGIESGGVANTALVVHADRLLALVESSVPTALRLLEGGAVETLGAFDLGGKLQHPFTAHPKVCPVTGEMMFFGYRVDAKPYCSYSVVDAAGALVRTVDVGLARPIMMHDFAITTRHSVFMDLPLLFTPKQMMTSLSGGAFTLDLDAPARFGVLPRHGASADAVRWFDVAPCSVFHTANAFDDDSAVVVHACRIGKLDLFDMTGSAADLDNALWEWRLDLATGRCTEGPVVPAAANGGVPVSGDFPQINPRFLGRRHRYVYVATFSPENNAKFDGVVKVDVVARRVVGEIHYGPGKLGGECVFVERARSHGGTGAEDDGYLVGFVHDERANKTQFWVMDARTMAREPLARVALPRRVPYGFHALFVPEARLRAAERAHAARVASGTVGVRSRL